MSPLFPSVAALTVLLLALNGRWRARHIRQWQFGVLASEFGIYFAPASIVVAGWAAYSGPAGIPAAILATLATAFFLCPEVLSRRLLNRLPEQLEATFGTTGEGRATSPRAPDETAGDAGRLGEAPLPFSFDYPAAGGITRRILFYPAAGNTPAPCVVMVHSGGWESGSPEEFAACHAALARAGYAVACVGYGLAPEFSWPTPRDDVRAAIALLKTRSGELGIAPDNFILLGRSAGGQVALCVAYDDPDPAIRGVASFYAPTDMVFSWRGAYDGDILNSPRLMKNYLGGRPAEAPENHASASPIRFAEKRRVVPTLLMHGLRDEIVWCIQLRRLAHVLRRNHTPVLAIIVPWGRHAFDYRLRGPGGRVAFLALTGFLDSVAKR